MMNSVDGLGWDMGVGVGWVSGVCLVLGGYTHTALLNLSPPNPHTTPSRRLS